MKYPILPWLLVLVARFAFIEHALSLPLGLDYTSGTQGTPPKGSRYESVINKAIVKANMQLHLMKTCVDAVQKKTDHDGKQLLKIKTVFGPTPNMGEIERIVNAIVKGTMKVAHYNFPVMNKPHMPSYYAVVHSDNTMDITDMFYDHPGLDDWKRVLILIHEASHYFGNAFDLWEWDHTKTKLFPVPPEIGRDHAFDGSWNMGYDLVFKYGTKYLHKNAETFGIFGYYLEQGDFPPHNPNYREYQLQFDPTHIPPPRSPKSKTPSVLSPHVPHGSPASAKLSSSSGTTSPSPPIAPPNSPASPKLSAINHFPPPSPKLNPAPNYNFIPPKGQRPQLQLDTSQQMLQPQVITVSPKGPGYTPLSHSSLADSSSGSGQAPIPFQLPKPDRRISI